MLIEHESAFVLHARRWRETSLLVDVLSQRHGRIGLLARGVQGPKKQTLRAALQPLQLIRINALQRGELAQLRQVEALDNAPRLAGEAMLAGFYISELMLRLVPRHDPVPALYHAYGEVRAALADVTVPLSWVLRRFERDLLEELGFGFNLRNDAEDRPIDPAACYRLDAHAGPWRVLGGRLVEDRGPMVMGSALLALAADVMPAMEDMSGLRRSMRGVLRQHLGERGLKSWEMLEDLVRRG